MFGLFVFLGFGIVLASLVTLIIFAFKRKKKKKATIALVCGAVLFIVGVVNISHTTYKIDEYNFDKSEFIPCLKEPLKSIGVQEITYIKEKDNGVVTETSKELEIKTDKKTIYAYISKNGEMWEVFSINDSTNITHTFYSLGIYDDQDRLLRDIYDYNTGEIKEYANEVAVKEREEGVKKNQDIAKAKEDTVKQDKIDVSKTILDEIGNAFKSNSISASEKYQDKEYYITATVDSVDTTITGKPRITVYQSDYKVQCVFNEGMLDKVKEVNTGDEITFYGTLDGWGVSADFTHCYFR